MTVLEIKKSRILLVPEKYIPKHELNNKELYAKFIFFHNYVG